MLQTKIIGIGAAGNKAAIAAVENGVVELDNILLINSTLRDVPQEFHDFAIEMNGSNGCAKKRGIARKMMLDSLSNGDIVIDTINKKDINFITIVFSAEGGTGSGASIELANKLYDAGANVHLTILCGFEEDPQGLKNTIDLFKEIQTENVYTVDVISNKKFLDSCKGNRRKAEEAANLEFCERIKILLGKKLVDSNDNIDDMDLATLVNTPGYMDIVHGEFGKPSNEEEFNAAVKKLIDETKSYASDPSCTSTAVILNRSERVADYTNYCEDIIGYVYGDMATGKYTHTQCLEGLPNTIDIIVAGRNLPIDTITEIYNEYKKAMEAKEKRNVLSANSFDMFETSSDDAPRRRRGGATANAGSFENTKKMNQF